MSVIQYINKLINNAIEQDVSDIHLEPFEKKYRIRYRIDGELRIVSELPVAQKDELISRIKIMSNLDISEKRKPQDGKIVYEYKDYQVDIRVSFLPTNYGQKTVLRILDKHRQKFTLESLGFSPEMLEIIHKTMKLPHGMILVTGPTGSGKTSTLYSVLSELNKAQTNITTIEDPIEYHIEGVNQTQVKEDIGYSFANALRAILRQDPDVIMVGEIRDYETSEIAIRSSLTGHLVLSTLHTNDIISTITRLLDMGVEKFLLGSSLRVIVAQRLIKKICTHCRVEYIPSETLLKELDLSSEKIYYQGKGCPECNQSGYKGRTAIAEILYITEEVADIISHGDYKKELKNRITSLKHSALEKVYEGVTTLDEIYKKVLI